MNEELGCEAFQSLLSADLDGELDTVEQERLRSHLAECARCHAWQSQIRVLARQLESLVAADAGDQPAPPDAVLRSSVNGHPSDVLKIPATRPAAWGERLGSWSGYGLWAAAAVALLAVSISLSRWSRYDEPRSALNVEQLVAMQAMNEQAEHDQRALIRTFELDLRAMKLEMHGLELDSAAREQLGGRIDQLLAKARRMDVAAATPISFSGEIP
jgi:anti-sigma factor RsiW